MHKVVRTMLWLQNSVAPYVVVDDRGALLSTTRSVSVVTLHTAPRTRSTVTLGILAPAYCDDPLREHNRPIRSQACPVPAWLSPILAPLSISLFSRSSKAYQRSLYGNCWRTALPESSTVGYSSITKTLQ
ncbi:hypothetical protein AcW2_006934 [Taiwanofungus camphoratus]|nr:hypothetical protein AcW2_006934 [Antrodia cinnamomea]